MGIYIYGENVYVFEKKSKDFPSSPVVRTACFHCRVMDLIPCQGTKILYHVAWPIIFKKLMKSNERTNRNELNANGGILGCGSG